MKWHIYKKSWKAELTRIDCTQECMCIFWIFEINLIFLPLELVNSLVRYNLENFSLIHAEFAQLY